MAMTAQVTFAIAAYALCSSSMLFLNKLSVSYMPDEDFRLLPGPISCMQLLFAVLFCVGLKLANLTTYDGISKKILQMYALYGVLFVGSVYASMQALKVSNVETQIVFRSASPLAVSFLDFIFLGRALPSGKSLLSLVGILIGAIAYVLTDSEFKMSGFAAYTWISIYFVLICAEMTIGKHMMQNYKLSSIWGSVLLTNATALPQMFLLSFGRGEFTNLHSSLFHVSRTLWVIIFGSCVVGTLIGWTGWNCRNIVSATSYTLIGVVNKLLTVILSVVFLEKHASVEGLVSLGLCIAASTLYRQPPMRTTKLIDENELSEFEITEEGKGLRESSS